MLNENQIKRLLKHCEEIAVEEAPPSGPIEYQWEWSNNQGWCQALRLVLEEDTYPIRKDPIDV